MHRGAQVDNGSAWLTTVRTYLAAIALGNLIWEAAHFPLYTIWREGTREHLMLAMFHGTAGDVFVAAAALMMSLVLVGNAGWPTTRFWHVACMTGAFGLGFTFYSEWMNVEVRHVWAYSVLMPRLPVIGTGLSPVMQWIVVPAVAFAIIFRRRDRGTAFETKPPE